MKSHLNRDIKLPVENATVIHLNNSSSTSFKECKSILTIWINKTILPFPHHHHKPDQMILIDKRQKRKDERIRARCTWITIIQNSIAYCSVCLTCPLQMYLLLFVQCKRYAIPNAHILHSVSLDDHPNSFFCNFLSFHLSQFVKQTLQWLYGRVLLCDASGSDLTREELEWDFKLELIKRVITHLHHPIHLNLGFTPITADFSVKHLKFKWWGSLAVAGVALTAVCLVI